ncbi:Transcriptional regulatory protein SrrA [subsurface metagenome]
MAEKLKAKTVLIIDDEADVRLFTKRVLELEGCRVFEAEDGLEGLKLARENPLALILLDLRLPGYDGWSVLSQLKNEPELSAIPVIMLTASVEASQRSRALAAGATDYLVKPLSAASLRETITRVLHQKRKG